MDRTGVTERSRSGKKRFEDSYKKSIEVRASIEKGYRNGRRRFDHSPTNQHLKTSINLKWN